jgi:metal-responsive CopG/Arc/MetJ family transcriptional regulator
MGMGIDVPDEIIESLDLGSKQARRSRAALIREAISEHLRNNHPPPTISAFGIWNGKLKVSHGCQAALRSDWGME